MPRDLRVFLWDAIEAATDILEFVKGVSADDYSKNPMLKAAVERKFEIIGEALRQASRYFPDVETRIADCQRIIAFRNRLIHGYSVVSDALVWDIIESNLPKLKSDAETLLQECEGTCRQNNNRGKATLWLLPPGHLTAPVQERGNRANRSRNPPPQSRAMHKFDEGRHCGKVSSIGIPPELLHPRRQIDIQVA